MRTLRIERMEKRELLAADGIGAAVEFVETDTATTIQVSTPSGRVIVREVGKRLNVNPEPNGNSPVVTGVVVVRNNEVSVTLEDRSSIETTNGEALLQAGQIEDGAEVKLVTHKGKPASTPPGPSEPVILGTISGTGGKK